MSSGRSSPDSNEQELERLEFIALDSDADVGDYSEESRNSPHAGVASRRLRTQSTTHQRIQAIVVLLALAALIVCVVAALIWQEGRPPPAELSSTQAQWEVLESETAVTSAPSTLRTPVTVPSSASLTAAEVAEAAAASWDLDALPQRCGSDAASRDKLPPEDKVIKSASDAREHRAVELPGGLVALLTSDPTADMAAAAVDVGVGSIDDPKDFQGLAHFLEHMLFMGTKKYPAEDAYSKFIDENVGENNAFTDEEHTNFFFKVPASVLPEALDRFAQFFAEPLLHSGSAAREVHAVDAEHHKNLNDDSWRINQLELSSCSGRVDHFGTGDKTTLKGGSAETVAALREFHKKFYVAENLRLSVLGAEPLDDLEKMVRTAFAGVRQGAPPRKSDQASPAASATGLCPNGQVYIVEPVGDLQDLMLTWPTRELRSAAALRTGVDSLLSSVLGGRHEGSLYADLKRRGFATSVGFDIEISLNDLSVMGLSISLTKAGLQALPDVVEVALGHVRLIVDTMEAYARSNSSDTGLCSLWSDVLAIDALNFHFAEKVEETDFVSGVSAALQDLPPRDALGSTTAFQLDSAVIQAVASSLKPTVNLPNVYVVASGYDGGDLSAALQRRTEPIYGTSYLAGKIPDKLAAHWSSLEVPSFAALPWNSTHLLPKHLQLLPKPEGELATRRAGPKHLDAAHQGRQYDILYKPDAEYRNPVVYLRCLAATPAAGDSAASAMEALMLTRALADGLEVPLNDAALAGYSWAVDAGALGMSFMISGYSGGWLADVAHRVLAALREPPELAPGRFEALLEAERRRIRSERNKPLYEVMFSDMAPLAFSVPAWSWDELLSALDKVSWNATLARARAIRSAAAVTCFAHGDISEKEALDLATTTAESMAEDSRAIESVPMPGVVVLPPKELEDFTEFRSAPLVPGDENAAVILTFQLEPPSNRPNRDDRAAEREELRQAAAMLLLSSLGQQRAFNQLRTKESLGYVVDLWTQPENVKEAANGCVWAMNILVQSGVKSATYLRHRIALFLDALLAAFGGLDVVQSRRLNESDEGLAQVTDEDLQMAKQGLITTLLKRPDTLAGEGDRIWSEIVRRRFYFSRQWDLAEVVKDVSLKDIADVLRALLKPGSAARKAAVEVWSSGDGDPFKESTAVSLSDMAALRRWKEHAGNWSGLLSSREGHA